MDFIDSAGMRIGFEWRGQGPPLVLLHGLPGDSRMWRRQLDALADEFLVVAWDAPGCGQSADPDGPISLNDVARCLVDLIDGLGLERPHVLGLSWGGGIALELYRIAPTVPRSLVLAAAYAGWGGSLPPEAVATRLDAYVAAARTSPSDAMRAWGPGFFSEAAPADRVEELLGIVADFHPDALASHARSFAESDLRPMLPTIRVPTLLLYGDADARSPLDVARALEAAIAGSQLVVLPGVGHVSNMEAPEAFDSAVRRFLRSVPG